LLNINTGEDCLYLNVFTPSVINKPLPVMVWFYGGCWTGGATSFPLYNGQYLASNYPVIIVTVNYRLGAFGFVGRSVPLNATGAKAYALFTVVRLLMKIQIMQLETTDCWINDMLYNGFKQTLPISAETKLKSPVRPLNLTLS